MRKEDADGQQFTVTCRGLAVRRRDIPTLAQQKAEERKEQGVPQDVSPEGAPAGQLGSLGAPCRAFSSGSHALQPAWRDCRIIQPHPAPPCPTLPCPADKQRYLQGYRLIKSRFGSGKCGICDGTIDQGERIAKRQGDDTPGGWSHATCVVQQLKEGGEEGEEAEEGSDGEEEEAAEEEEESKAPRAVSGGKRKRQPPGRGSKKQPASKRARTPAAKGQSAHAAACKGRRTRAHAEE